MDSDRQELSVRPSRRSRGARIRFLVEGGSGIGLGHVVRTAVLAAEARRQGHPVTVALRGDPAAYAALAAELPGVAIDPWIDAESAVSTGGPVVIDSPGLIGAELRLAKERGLRSLVLDRVDHLDDADATVLPIIHGPDIDHPRLFQGPEYLFVSQSVTAAASAHYPGDRDTAVITAGGADPLGLTVPLTEGLMEVLTGRSDAPQVQVVIGPAFKGADATVKAVLPLGVSVHRAPSRVSLISLLARARFALTGFGTTVYDLAVLGTPVLYWTHRSGDLDAARRLEVRGIGALGGDGSEATRANVAARLGSTAMSSDWCAAASERGRRVTGEANGARAILELLETHHASPVAA